MRQKLFMKVPGKKKNAVTAFLKQAAASYSFVHIYHAKAPQPFWITYFHTLIDPIILHQHILPLTKKEPFHSYETLIERIPLDYLIILDDIDEIKNKLYTGYVMIQIHESDRKCLLIDAGKKRTRKVETSSIEFTVLGPKEAFVEELDTNLNLIRQRLPLPKLVFEELLIGKLSKTRVVIAYVEGIANEENVNTMVQRLNDLEFDIIDSTSTLQQLINDNTNSVFPQYMQTERPDRAAALLGEGKVLVLSKGSSLVLSAPTSYFEMFTGMTDYYMPWILASFFRMLRFFAIFFSVVASSVYTAVLTYHYSMIPKSILSTVIAARRDVPYPPVVEVLFMELTIELLREAGVRLPTKVGQTLGIVGGIVIGQAAVIAGLTSNVLLIIVALAALATFTTPDYKMADSIRFIRYPFILCAAFWGGLGLTFCFIMFIVHLLRLTSLGRPFFSPFYPPRGWDFRDSFIRFSFSKLYKRPIHLQTEDRMRFNRKRANRKKDIDDS